MTKGLPVQNVHVGFIEKLVFFQDIVGLILDGALVGTNRLWALCRYGHEDGGLEKQFEKLSCGLHRQGWIPPRNSDLALTHVIVREVLP